MIFIPKGLDTLVRNLVILAAVGVAAIVCAVAYGIRQVLS